MSAIAELISATAVAVGDDPARAQVVFRAENDLVGTCEVASAASGFSFTVDEPASLGGTNLAPNPVEYALASLGSCQAITYRFWSEKLGIPFDRLSVTVEGDLDVRGFFGIDEAVRAGFSGVRVRVAIEGGEPAERYEQLRAAVDAHCPVLDIFQGVVPVTTTVG